MHTHRHEVAAYIALGANLGDAQSTVSQALQDLTSLPNTRVLNQSSLYHTAPIDSSGPDYVNAVAAIATQLGPYELLAHLQQMELAAGRQRPHTNAPRTLDLDLLLYGSAQVFSPVLTVPHPRMMQRAFVLLPLHEIAPHLVDPAALQAVASQSVKRHLP